MSKTGDTWTGEELAKFCGVTLRHVNRLAAEGVLPKLGRNLFPVLPSLKAFIGHQADRRNRVEEAGDEEENDRKRLLKAKADVAEAEAAKMLGDLLARDAVAKAWLDIVARFRARSLAIPNKVAPVVSVDDTIEGCFRKIQAAIHEALDELATDPDYGSESAPGVGEDGSSDGGAAAEPDDIGMGRPVPPPVKRGKRGARAMDHGAG